MDTVVYNSQKMTVEEVIVNEARGQDEVRKYDPNKFLDAMRDNLRLKNDAALCRTLDILPPVISKIRHGRSYIGGSLLIRIHEVTGLNVADLRFLLGAHRVDRKSVV